MSDKVLSEDEVEALLNVSQNKFEDLDKLIGSIDSSVENVKNNAHAITNIGDLTRYELEKNLSTFYRNKVFVKSKTSNIVSAKECIKTSESSVNIYTAFRLMPHECYGIFSIDNVLIYQTINKLFGSKVNPTEKAPETIGKVSMIVAEKITQLFLNSFKHACSEYTDFENEILRTTTSLNLAYSYGIEENDSVYCLEYSFIFDDFESHLLFVVSDTLLNKLFNKKVEDSKHKKSSFWKTAIQNQVVDSAINLSISLPDVSLSANDFMKLKEGDLLPISDPTNVYVCLNTYKLFKAKAGQSNSKIVVKITEQI